MTDKANCGDSQETDLNAVKNSRKYFGPQQHSTTSGLLKTKTSEPRPAGLLAAGERLASVLSFAGMLTRAGLANPARCVWPGQSSPRHVGAEAVSVVQRRPVSRWQVYHNTQKRETSAFVALRVTRTVW